MKYMLIAGEASGDLHASHLIASIRRLDPEARFAFLGGDLMAREAGAAPLVHYRDMAYMGFTDVLRHLPQVRRNLAIARRALVEFRPDRLVLVDYPSFNLKIAARAHRLGIPVHYYISPKIWAWKEWRIKQIRRYVDRVICIFPFEPAWYAARGYDRAVYVGNPSVEEMDFAMAHATPRAEFLKANRLRDHRIIALLPGSRRGEIRANLPLMNEAAHRFPQYTIVVAGAPGIPDDFYSGLTRFAVVRDRTHQILAHAHAAIVTSGTATLEAALAGVPQVVAYRSNGSKLTYAIMERLLHIKYVSLPNLVADAPVVPELLLHHCTADALAEALQLITPDASPARLAMLEGYGHIRSILGTARAADGAAAIIAK